MLEPEHRSLLLDNLRPPAGYQLDRAVGTTFSLDLDALLTVPLAFAMFDTSTPDETPDIIALLEATRRHAGCISLFCQAGRISLPKNYSKVLANVEGSIHEVTAPRGGVFHPKVWALRFVADDEPDMYRLLVLSRNLTFDRSWDVIVRLDGQQAPVGERSQASETNRPLTDFLQRLPDLAVHPLSDDERAHIDAFVKTLRQVQFRAPDGFHRVSFHPSGLTAKRPDLFGDHSRALVMSPFLTAGLLRQVTASGSRHALISRREALDALPVEALTGFDTTYILDAAVENLDEEDDMELTGLHAKVFVVEHRGQVSVYAGSANATDAGFGHNVEFLAGLHGNRHTVGIDTVLESGDHRGPGLIDLLAPYAHPGTAHDETPADQLERRLDELRHAIAAIPIAATVKALPDKDFAFHVSSTQPLPAIDMDASVKCWLATRGSGSAHTVTLGKPLDVRFDRVSFEAITPFIAFEVTLRDGRYTQTVRFVINAKLDGPPEDRSDRILSSLLDDRSKVLRYLLFLLADPNTPDVVTLELLRNATAASDSDGNRAPEVPLLESMLRSLARDPSRLDHVNRLIEDLSKTGEGRRLLPDGTEQIWPVIWQARLEAAP